jgi:hypothetical protein
MIEELRLMIEHPEEGVLTANELNIRRLRVEALLRSKTMLQPDLDPATFSPSRWARDRRGRRLGDTSRAAPSSARWARWT